jgi:hypothetical protein
MAYEISHPEGCDYVVVKCLESVSSVDVRSAGAEASKLLAGNNLSSLLFDIRALHNEPATFELFDWTSKSGETVPRRTRIAVVGRSDQAGNLTFVSHVARNRGKPIEVFTDENAALGWLSE